jgi:hypothetical protein
MQKYSRIYRKQQTEVTDLLNNAANRNIPVEKLEKLD